jgi:endonuclease/exonuclease/phosphatase family metal-dependent hydrolase
MRRRFRSARTASPLALLLALAACRATHRQTPAELRVLVYNMHAGKDAKNVDNLERVAAIVRDTRADLVLLQEVDRGTERSGRVDQPALLERLTGLHAAMGKTLDYQGGDYGIAILSRWPIRHDTLVHLPVDPPQPRAGGSTEPRGALVADIAAPSGTITLVNTHLDASRDDTYRLQEIDRLVALVRARAERDPRAVVLAGGDLNSTPDSPVQARTRDAGWQEAWTTCADAGAGAGLTYPADVPVKRIDYLYFVRGARCSSARVLVTEASDHRPLFVQVTLGAAR